MDEKTPIIDMKMTVNETELTLEAMVIGALLARVVKLGENVVTLNPYELMNVQGVVIAQKQGTINGIEVHGAYWLEELKEEIQNFQNLEFRDGKLSRIKEEGISGEKDSLHNQKHTTSTYSESTISDVDEEVKR